jgi:predicted nucleic acid-binding protein
LILLDTNILLRYARTADPDFATVDTAVNTLHANGEVLCVVPQNVYEFWAVATRPTAANGLGFSAPECQVQVARIKRLFRFASETREAGQEGYCREGEEGDLVVFASRS